MSDIRDNSRPSTLHDVARLAGVSIATASKAINGKNYVAAATKERVLSAAGELSFIPNVAARNLLAGRTGTVGLLASDLEGRFMIPVLIGAEDAFGAGQINVFLCDARGDSIREQHHLRALLSRRVDGIIVVGDTTNRRRSLGKVGQTPIVYAYAPSEDPADTSVVPDGVDGAQKVISHLASIGRRRIAHITGEYGFAAAQDRARGVLHQLETEGLPLVGSVMYGTWSEAWGRDAAALLIEQHPDIDAIACGSDQIARGVLHSLAAAGRRVPEDVAVVGYDDWAILATQSTPQLTTVNSRLEDLGRKAATYIFDSLAGNPPPPGVTELPGELVIRNSTIASRS